MSVSTCLTTPGVPTACLSSKCRLSSPRNFVTHQQHRLPVHPSRPSCHVNVCHQTRPALSVTTPMPMPAKCLPFSKTCPSIPTTKCLPSALLRIAVFTPSCPKMRACALIRSACARRTRRCSPRRTTKASFRPTTLTASPVRRVSRLPFAAPLSPRPCHAKMSRFRKWVGGEGGQMSDFPPTPRRLGKGVCLHACLTTFEVHGRSILYGRIAASRTSPQNAAACLHARQCHPQYTQSSHATPCQGKCTTRLLPHVTKMSFIMLQCKMGRQ